MFGVNFFVHQIGTVAIFATLFVASYVKGETGCVFDFEQGESDFDFECNDLKKLWTIQDINKDSIKKAAVLPPDQEGCLKTKHPMTLNSSTAITLKLHRDGSEEKGKLIIRLKPKTGSCADEECVWNVDSDEQFKTGQWITADHKFPLKEKSDYYIQIEAGKSKGRLSINQILIPSAVEKAGKCRPVSSYETEDIDTGNEINLIDQTYTAAVNASEGVPIFNGLSKTLIITSASVLTLNNLFN